MACVNNHLNQLHKQNVGLLNLDAKLVKFTQAQNTFDGQVANELNCFGIAPVDSTGGGSTLSETLTARWPQLRVLFMSGYTHDEIIRRGIGSGARLLEKPFSAEQIANAVREALDRPPPAA